MSITYLRAAVACVVLMLATLPAGAQTPEQQIQAALDRARQAGVPAELLESKIAEGRAKGVAEARIAQAVTHRLDALERVQARLAEAGHDLTTEELGVAADAAQAGVSDVVLEAVVSNTPLERRAVAMAALSQLVQLGHAPQEAYDKVKEALARGPDALMNLPAQAAAARGGRPVDIPVQVGPPAGTPAGGKPTTTPTPPVSKPPTGGRSGRGGG